MQIAKSSLRFSNAWNSENIDEYYAEYFRRDQLFKLRGSPIHDEHDIMKKVVEMFLLDLEGHGNWKWLKEGLKWHYGVGKVTKLSDGEGKGDAEMGNDAKKPADFKETDDAMDTDTKE